MSSNSIKQSGVAPDFQQRRRFPRLRLPPRLRVKARLKVMGKTVTHYLTVDNLSMGGANLTSQKGLPFSFERGAVLQILLYSGNLSLSCVAKVAQATFVERQVAKNAEVAKLCVQLGIEIIGIDENSRKTLADFLETLSKSKDLE